MTARRWGRAYDASALLGLPASPSWTDWPGRWGVHYNLLQWPFVSGPRSPGDQRVKFQCALVDNDEDSCFPPPARGNTQPPSGGGGVATATSVHGSAPDARRVLRGSPGMAALSCDSWIGNGIVQARAAKLLASGARIVLRGRRTARERILVRTYDRTRQRVLVASFRLPAAKVARASRAGARPLRLTLRVGARSHVTLGGVRATSVRPGGGR